MRNYETDSEVKILFQVNKMADDGKESQDMLRSHVHRLPGYRLPRKVRTQGKRDLGRSRIRWFEQFV
jgi:hypothetical protein